MKWEFLVDKRVRHTYASKVAFLFREFPNYTEDVETKWDLFKSAVITSAAASCGYKRVGSQMGSEKGTIWWKKKLKKLSVQRKLHLELS